MTSGGTPIGVAVLGAGRLGQTVGLRHPHRDGRQPAPGPEDALETLRLAIACTRSQFEGRPVRLDEVTA